MALHCPCRCVLFANAAPAFRLHVPCAGACLVALCSSPPAPSQSLRGGSPFFALSRCLPVPCVSRAVLLPVLPGCGLGGGASFVSWLSPPRATRAFRAGFWPVGMASASSELNSENGDSRSGGFPDRAVSSVGPGADIGGGLIHCSVRSLVLGVAAGGRGLICDWPRFSKLERCLPSAHSAAAACNK